MKQDSYLINLGRWIQRAIDFFIPVMMLFFLEFLLTDFDWLPVNTLLGVGAGLLIVFLSQIFGSYRNYFNDTLDIQIKLVFQHWYLAILLLVFFAFISATPMEIGRKVTLAWVFVTPFVLFGLKRLSLKLYLSRKVVPTRVILIGESYEFNSSELNYLKNRHILVDYLPESADLTDLPDSFKKPDIYVLNTSSQLAPELVKQLTQLELSSKINILTMQYFFESYLRKCFVGFNKEEITFFHDIQPLRFDQLLLKRTIDIGFTLIMLIVSIPLFVYSVIRIKRESPGKVFFSQERIGINASKFMVYKFRSMHENSHFNPYTQTEDSRIFPYGKKMRQLRIDEIPQCWNVIKGDMHLCGPRAEWGILVDNYEKEIPFYHERHLISPGITGWAQVMYPYGANIEDARQKLMYDLYYIKNWSVWLEIEIILKTILVVLGKKGL